MSQTPESESSLLAQVIPADIDVATAYTGTPHEQDQLAAFYAENPDLFDYLRTKLAELVGDDPDAIEGVMTAANISMSALANSFARREFAKKIDVGQLTDPTSTTDLIED